MNNAWFELELKTARMLNYRVSIRAASAMGTKIAIASFDGAAAVTQRLRFTNLSEGVNVDFVTFSAGSFDDVVTVQSIANDGPDINPLKGFSTGWWRNEDYASVGF